MSDLLLPGLNNYIDTLLPQRDKILKEMEAYAAQQNFPIVGPQVGRFLFQLAYLVKPANIFEMGSGFGYSAYWFCLGAPQARVTLTDLSADNLVLAKNWFKEAKKDHQIEMKQGDAREIIGASAQNYDIIFIDVDKHEYPEAFSLALNKLRHGGVVITDNVLWYGKVVKKGEKDKDTAAVELCNKMLFQTPDIYSTIIPIRDGLGLTIKI